MDDSTCSYCCETLQNMTDPRVLPCSHTFCLECMKGSSRDLLSHQCAICRRVYETLDFYSLPSPEVDQKASGGDRVDTDLIAVSAKLMCDNPRCKGQPAVGYCIDCGEKSCCRHMEFHDGYYEGVDHEKVDIMQYAKNPSLYIKALTCSLHRKEAVSMACKTCHVYNCLQCDHQKLKQCQGSPGEHIYLPMKDIESELKTHFNQLFTTMSTKLVKIAEMEKAAWNRMDSLKTSCEKMIANLNKTTEEQMALIQTQSSELKVQINQYEVEKTKQIVSFVTGLLTKKEEIEEVRRSTHQFLADIHVTDLIKHKEEKTKLLKTTNDINLGSCDWTNMELHIGTRRKMEVDFRLAKKTLASLVE